MPHASSQSTIAGAPRRAAARGHDAGRRRTPADELRLLSLDVDRLLRLESLEARSSAEHDRRVALAEEIAARGCTIKQHYRGPSTNPCHPPLGVSADGRKAAW